MTYMTAPGIKMDRRLRRSAESANDILATVASYFHMTVYELKKKGRQRSVVTARHVCYHILRAKTALTILTIGSLFNQDHTTVIHGIRAMNDLIETDEQTRKDISYLMTIV